MQLSDFANSRKLILGAIGTVIVVILIVIVFSLLSKQKSAPTTKTESSVPETNSTQINKVPAPIVSPESIPASVKDIKTEIIKNPIKDDNGDLILEENTNYQIKYVPPADVFFVYISQSPNESKNSAETWFKNFGLEQNDLCQLSIRFLLKDLSLRQQNPGFTSLPTGCTS